MYRNLIKFEFRKHFKVFVIGFICTIILNIVFIKSTNGSFDMIYILSNLVLNTLILAYVFLNIYNEFYTRKDIMMNIIPIKKSKLFFVKVLVFTVGLILIWLPSFIKIFFDKYGVYNKRIISSSKPLEGIIYIIFQKILGTVTGLILIGVSIAVAKCIYNKKLSKSMLPSIYFLVTYGIYRINKVNISNGEKIYYAIGTVSNEAFKNYVGFIPIMFTKSKHILDISNTIYWNSIYINIITSIIGIFIIKLIFNSKRYRIQ